MDIIELLERKVHDARDVYGRDRTTKAHDQVEIARGELAVARALLDCGYRPLPEGGWRLVETTSPFEVGGVVSSG